MAEKRRESSVRSKTWRGYLIVVAIFFVSFIFTLTPPLFMEIGREDVAGLNYVAYRQFCHQLDSRSLHLWSHKLGVCARCFGIYLGFLAGALIYPLFRDIQDSRFPPARWLALAALPMAVDGFTQLAGLRESFNLLRLATGLVFGVAVGYYMIVVVAVIFRDAGESMPPKPI